MSQGDRLSVRGAGRPHGVISIFARTAARTFILNVRAVGQHGGLCSSTFTAPPAGQRQVKALQKEGLVKIMIAEVRGKTSRIVMKKFVIGS